MYPGLGEYPQSEVDVLNSQQVNVQNSQQYKTKLDLAPGNSEREEQCPKWTYATKNYPKFDCFLIPSAIHKRRTTFGQCIFRTVASESPFEVIADNLIVLPMWNCFR